LETKVDVIVPPERLGALIGHDGKVKGDIELAFQVEINVDSKSGLVEIRPKQGSTDPAALLKAKDVVTAIGRGFSPQKAFDLLDDDTILDIIDLRQLFGKSDPDIRRIKGRIIGADGKTRRIVEEMTGASISVYGHTIAIIGNYEDASTAREAIEMLVKGRQHATVYRILRRKRREAKKKKTLELWEKPIPDAG